MELYESSIRKIPEPSAYDIWEETKKLKLLEKRDLEFADKLGYSSLAKCIEKEFNGDYQLFKKELNKKWNTKIK